MLCVNYVGLFDDLGNSVRHMVSAQAHSIGHLAKRWSQQHGLMTAAAKPVGQQFNNGFGTAIVRHEQIGDENPQMPPP